MRRRAPKAMRTRRDLIERGARGKASKEQEERDMRHGRDQPDEEGTAAMFGRSETASVAGQSESDAAYATSRAARESTSRRRR